MSLRGTRASRRRNLLDRNRQRIHIQAEPHQVGNDGSDDLVHYVIADNPIGETCFYPDSEKWAVRSPAYRFFRGKLLDYYDGEE